MPTNIKMVVSELSFKLREGWRTKVHDIMEQCNRRAHLQDLSGETCECCPILFMEMLSMYNKEQIVQNQSRLNSNQVE